jgi:uncharacterized protein involved in exopolysaccharide biosynthesis
MTDRIASMREDIESRTALSTLITDKHLYTSDLKSEAMEDVVNKMRSAISIRQGPITNAQGKGSLVFEVAYQYSDRKKAYEICSELVSRFMNTSTQATSESQTQANDFLNGERKSAKDDLDKAEQKLADFRASHAGSLPDEMPANLQQMTAVQTRLNSLSDAATRTSERRMMLESNLRIAKEHLNTLRQTSSASPANTARTSELDKQIADLETNIASLKDRYTPEMPELQSAQERLAVLRRQRDEANKLASAKPTSSDQESPLAARERFDSQAAIESIESQLKATAMEEQSINKEIIKANADFRNFQSRMAGAPGGEMEYSDLVVARDNARQKFLDLDKKAHTSDISKDLERARQGETLEIIDNPSLPTEPTEPKRGLIIPIGAVGGLALGIVLVLIREMKDTSLKNLKDARLYTQLSILGSIPLLENDVVVQRRKQVMLVSWATAMVLGIAIVVVTVARYYYYVNKA